MLQAILQVVLPCWKLVLAAGVAYFAAGMYTEDYLRYSKRRRLGAFFVLVAFVGLFLVIVVSPNSPTSARFWMSWYFADDVGIVLISWGLTGLYKLLRFDARKAAPLV
jgi:hypothetical protein